MFPQETRVNTVAFFFPNTDRNTFALKSVLITALGYKFSSH